MPRIKIEGIPPWDGELPLDLSYFTNRELHTIKEIADVRAGELEDEFDRGNNDLIVAVALIAARRAGRDIPIDDLWDAPVGRITLEGDEVEEDLASAPPSVNGGHDSTDDGPTTSGAPSKATGGVQQETIPSSTGSRGSGSTAG